MTPIELMRWQWTGYSRYHRSRANLLLHIGAVPVFLAGNLLLVAALACAEWSWAVAGLVAMLAALIAQGRGHRREATPPEPFSGPLNAVARLLVEQWVTFPRFVLSGGWQRALRQAGTPLPPLPEDAS